MINKKWKCHYRRFELSEANIWMLLNRQKWPSSWIDPNLNSKSHKINLQLFNTESNLDTLWYLFIVNSRNNHWKSHRKNSCKQRWYVYNWGDFSFSTLFPSLRHRNNWQDIASTEILPVEEQLAGYRLNGDLVFRPCLTFGLEIFTL